LKAAFFLHFLGPFPVVTEVLEVIGIPIAFVDVLVDSHGIGGDRFPGVTVVTVYEVDSMQPYCNESLEVVLGDVPLAL